MHMTRTRTVSAKSAYYAIVYLVDIFLVAAFFFYLFCVLYLVLGERWIMGEQSHFHHPQPDIPYWTQIKMHIQAKPFRTILGYARRLPVSNPLRRIAFVNLVGNLALFFPMGVFLPCLWKKQRNFFIFSLTCILQIAFVEISQLFTLLGSFDIDDFILNYVGAVGGFLCIQIIFWIWGHIHARKI